MISYNAAYHLSFLGIVFFTGLILSLLLTPAMSKVGVRLGFIDNPDHRKIHCRPMPRSGGLAMITSFIVASILCLHLVPFITAILSGVTIILIVGILDDWNEITPKTKFAGQIMAAGCFIFL